MMKEYASILEFEIVFKQSILFNRYEKVGTLSNADEILRFQNFYCKKINFEKILDYKLHSLNETI